MMKDQKEMPATDTIILDGLPYVKSEISNGIQVTVHIPENIHERAKQDKINRIYDILCPKSFT